MSDDSGLRDRPTITATDTQPPTDRADRHRRAQGEGRAEIDSVDDIFPFETYRTHQREILQEAYTALFEEGYETVVIDGPTGVGKSPINTALARAAGSAFLTTPQKKLRRQLEDDETLSRHYTVLRARADYACYGGYNCSDCLVNEDPKLKCSHIPELSEHNSVMVVYDQDGNEKEQLNYPDGAAAMDSCTYWSEKQRAIDAQTAVITPSYLYVDGKLPDEVSFHDRDLLIIDECHALAEQAASLWAGFSLSPNTLPEDVYDAIADDLDTDMWRFEDVEEVLDTVVQEARGYIEAYQTMVTEDVRDPADPTTDDDSEIRKRINQCATVLDRIETVHDERASGREWVVEVDSYRGSSNLLKARLLPTEVDRLLRENIWSRANKYVLSTATLPHRGDPGRWLRSLGLDPDRAKIISKPMPFPAEHRLVNIGQMIGKFSSQADYNEYWEEIVAAVAQLARRHGDERGLVHTVSYDRAQRLAADLPADLADEVLVHRNDGENADDYYLSQWQDDETPERVLLSPSLTEGVDLPDEACRWQVLMKVPFMRTSRTDYMTQIEGDWDRYYDRVAREIIQAVGRAVRHNEDYATFYVLDASFVNVKKKATFPQWFLDAITTDREADHHLFRGGL